jgi:drug/metabolite transporter (DMT)-like permease
MSPPLIAGLSIILASLTWSTAGVTVKLLLPYFDPYTIAFIRFFLASIFIIPFVLREKHINWKHVFFSVIPIMFLSSLNVLFFYVGLTRTTVIAASIMYAAEPFLVAFFSWLILRDHLTKIKIAGLVIGFAGVLIILLLPALSKGQQITGDVFGNLLVFIGAIAWTFYTIGSKRLLVEHAYSPLFLSAISIFTSAVIFFIISLCTTSIVSIPARISFTHIILFINLALIVTVISFTLYQWAIKHSSTTIASLTNYLQPIFTTIIAIKVLHEQITIPFVLGSGLVMWGLLMISGKRLFMWVQGRNT